MSRFAVLLPYRSAGTSYETQKTVTNSLCALESNPNCFTALSLPTRFAVNSDYRNAPWSHLAPGGEVRGKIQKIEHKGKFIVRSYSLEMQESNQEPLARVSCQAETKGGNLKMRNQDKGACSKISGTSLNVFNSLLRTPASPCHVSPFSVTARYHVLVTWIMENHLNFTQENT